MLEWLSQNATAISAVQWALPLGIFVLNLFVRLGQKYALTSAADLNFTFVGIDLTILIQQAEIMETYPQLAQEIPIGPTFGILFLISMSFWFGTIWMSERKLKEYYSGSSSLSVGSPSFPIVEWIAGWVFATTLMWFHLELILSFFGALTND